MVYLNARLNLVSFIYWVIKVYNNSSIMYSCCRTWPSLNEDLCCCQHQAILVYAINFSFVNLPLLEPMLSLSFYWWCIHRFVFWKLCHIAYSLLSFSPQIIAIQSSIFCFIHHSLSFIHGVQLYLTVLSASCVFLIVLKLISNLSLQMGS